MHSQTGETQRRFKMLSLKTHSNFGSVLTLNFLHIKFSVNFVFTQHITRFWLSSVVVRNMILPVSFHAKINLELIRSEISKKKFWQLNLALIGV